MLMRNGSGLSVDKMQVANRTTRRYGTQSAKNRKHSNIPVVSPKKIIDKSNKPATLKKFVDRFRYDEPQPRPERESIDSDFWWLRDELKKTCCSDTKQDMKQKSNIPEFIQIFPSTDVDHHLNKRASSAHSSDIGNVSSTGVGSTTSTTMTTTTESSFQPIVYEKPARPIFTRITDSKFDYKIDGGKDDILYQWRLQRRLEQAQNGEPITFPSKISNVSPVRSVFPSIPINIPVVLTPPPVVQPPSPKRAKQRVTTPVPVRQYSEAATQTVQDACVQTSPTIQHHLSTSTNIPNKIDLRPTRDNHHHHHSPPRSKYEIAQISSSPSPIKRHHHHSFYPIVEHPTSTNTTYQQRQDDNDYSTDEVLNILIQKRDELLIAFRQIDQRLTNMNS